ncbi:enoyl-CoA hydratase/isomerase family protein [Salinadaptatus halalkaliphilus]|uniref:Enoyl-CoA hydratase/isomerase family protein n=1 Tax=Salinadaptatus halalkaliphilus TaxID=2419781 RepID=A0A4S3TLZ9_9EURY|nr:enoyl-CoA hydratase-related protein [Salinadaptatus halalkaliphilus]THE64025.1 enoyl-CoA hydratase/isomerase family protein [Salinadaptatus halalkaliphilus]
MKEFDNFAVEQTEDGIAYLSIESESAMNSLNDGMTEELLWLGTELNEDDDVRCIVLRGSDGVFCAGGNITSFEEDSSAAARLRRGASFLNDVVHQLKRGETPVVTGIDGPAVGAGFALALLGDITLMHEDAYLQFGYPGVGLTGDGSATYYLPHLVGLQEAKRIALLNEKIPPAEAEEIGLVTEVADANSFDDRLEELATSLASGPTKALGSISRQLEEASARQLSEHLAHETERISKASQTEDYVEGVQAFKEKRDPDFVGY